MSLTDGNLRVVVVDDESEICLMLRMQLSKQPDIDVVGTATNGSDALEVCKRERPHVVVMDLLMPVMNGFQAIEALRSQHPGIPIVAYTGVAGDFVRQEMERLGIPIVLKSGDVAPLVEAIHEVVGAP